MTLLQGWDRTQGFSLLGELPILLQLLPMEPVPLEHVSERASGKLPFDHTVPNPNRNLVFTINCMKMSRLMFPMEDRDDDAKKPTKLRHSSILPPTPNSRSSV